MNRHYFWAVKIPDEVKRELDKKINKVKSCFPFQRWVHYQDYHITLEFLGLAEQDKLQLCIEGIEAATQDMNSFNLKIVGLNIFGQASMPSVFWAEVCFEERLLELQQKVHDECTKAELELELRKYHPHLTLARKWSGQASFQKDSLKLYNPFLEAIALQVTEIVLYTVNNKDVLPKYVPVKTITLKQL